MRTVCIIYILYIYYTYYIYIIVDRLEEVVEAAREVVVVDVVAREHLQQGVQRVLHLHLFAR